MLKVNKVQLTKENKLELNALSDSGEKLSFELLFEDVPMIIQMLIAAQQQKERNDAKKNNHEPRMLINFIEGWQVFELPPEMPNGIGLHFQCHGNFDFAFAITEDAENKPADFQSDMNKLLSL